MDIISTIIVSRKNLLNPNVHKSRYLKTYYFLRSRVRRERHRQCYRCAPISISGNNIFPPSLFFKKRMSEQYTVARGVTKLPRPKKGWASRRLIILLLQTKEYDRNVVKLDFPKRDVNFPWEHEGTVALIERNVSIPSLFFPLPFATLIDQKFSIPSPFVPYSLSFFILCTLRHTFSCSKRRLPSLKRQAAAALTAGETFSPLSKQRLAYDPSMSINCIN